MDSNYEQYLEKRRREEREQRERQEKQCRAIAALFPEGKIKVYGPNREGWSGLFECLELADTNGASFGLRFESRLGKTRINVFGNWPSLNGHGTFSPSSYLRGDDNTYTSISVDASRPVEKIAADIRRRFLPGYLAAYALLVARRDAYAASDRQQADNVAEIARLIDGRVATHGEKNQVWGSIADVTVHSASADFTIRSLDIGKARKLAAFLRTLKGGAQ